MIIYLFLWILPVIQGFYLYTRDGDVQWDDYSVFETNVGFISMTVV